MEEGLRRLAVVPALAERDAIHGAAGAVLLAELASGHGNRWSRTTCCMPAVPIGASSCSFGALSARRALIERAVQFGIAEQLSSLSTGTTLPSMPLFHFQRGLRTHPGVRALLRNAEMYCASRAVFLPALLLVAAWGRSRGTQDEPIHVNR